MGSLNWEEGLKGAQQGMALLQRGSQHNTDIMYRQISDANMMRFRREEGALNREAIGEQRDATNKLA